LAAAVAAVAAVARTIARLHAAGVSHRDIKPNNLYRHNDRWLVGDFGLVAVPDVEELTKSGKSMGPVHFMAYEMLIDASSADPQAADVYSIGKTLWALTTQVPFPPLGHQSADSRGHAIADYRYHPNAGALDLLIDRCTRDDPKDRPNMAQVADELETWLKLTSDMPAIDVGVFRGPLLAALATELRDEDQTQERKELAYISVRRLAALFGPINAALRQLHPKAEIDGQADEFGRNVVRTLDTADAPEIVFRHQRLSQIKAGSTHNPYALRVTRSLELTADGQLILRLCILVAPTRTMGSDFTWMPEAWTASVGSVQVEEMLRDAIRQAGAQMVGAVRIFTERLAARG
jgi:serine/threonine protein kinase